MPGYDRESIQSAIRGKAETIVDAAGRKQTVLFEARALALAAENGCQLGKIFELALLCDILPFRYLRNQQALSAKDQLTLCQSAVAVVGAGGLGGYVADLLARAGIGALTLVDPDVFTESNLNRQRFAMAETLGTAKVDAAKAHIRAVNPGVAVSARRERLDAENGAGLLAGADAAVDGLDSIPSRLVLQDVCAKAGIPLIHGAIAGFEGQVLTIMPGDPGLKQLYGEDPPQSQAPESVLGVPCLTPLMIAGLQVMEVLKLLLNRGSPPSGRMIYLDLETPGLETFGFGNNSPGAGS